MTRIAKKSLSFGWLLFLALLPASATAQLQSEPARSSSGIEILKLKWEKQTRLPRNFDPSVIPDNDTFRTMESRTSAPGSTQAPYGDEARRDAAARSAALAPVDYFPNVPSRLPVSYVYSLSIRNRGSKTIDAIAWDYLFLDAGTRAIVGNHQLYSYAKSAAGTTITLQGRQRARPVTVVNAENAGRETGKKRKLIEQGVIQCVMYADGSAWKNPLGRDGSCEALRQNRPANQTRGRTTP